MSSFHFKVRINAKSFPWAVRSVQGKNVGNTNFWKARGRLPISANLTFLPAFSARLVRYVPFDTA